MTKGLIFDIKRYAINDGPGIRTTVFFKGCPLSCLWCHNPESILSKPQKLFTADKCIGCGECVTACPNDACSLTENGIVTEADKCEVCGDCADVCPTEATEISGKFQTVDDVLKAIEQETVFFDQSGGGVTFSGGEPLYQPEFLIALLDACKQHEIHRTVDTSGLVRLETLLEVAQKTDLFLYDLKIMDDKKHQQYTGVSNQKILSNLKKLAETGAVINIRIPLIKGVNDDDENIKAMAQFVSQLDGERKQVNLLPYHNIATPKYQKLGKTIDTSEMEEPDKAILDRIVITFSEFGLKAEVGG